MMHFLNKMWCIFVNKIIPRTPCFFFLFFQIPTSIYIYIYIYKISAKANENELVWMFLVELYVGMIVKVFAVMVQSQIESFQRLKKWYLMPSCLTLRIIRYRSRVKSSHPWNRVAPSATIWCSIYRKGRRRVIPDNSRLLYLFLVEHYTINIDLRKYYLLSNSTPLKLCY